MKRHAVRFSLFLVTCCVIGSGLVTSPASAGPSSLAADYQFQGTLGSCGPTAPALSNLGPGTNTFVTDTVDATTRQVLAFPLANGVSLNSTTGVVPNDHFSIVILARLDTVSGYRRLIDFKNGTSDNGLYVLSGGTNFYPVASGGTFPANTYVQVALTRDASGTVNVYTNGTPAFSFADGGSLAVIDANNVLRFFRDNEFGANSEHSAGAVARIRLYNNALTASEVAGLDRLAPCDNTAPTCSVTALRPGPPKQMDVTVQDPVSGLAAIRNVVISNGTVNFSLTPGTTTPVVVTATKSDPSQPTRWAFDAVDVLGNVKHCT